MSASSMHSCVGSSEGARRHALSGAPHRVSIGAVLVELQPFGCWRHSVGCYSVSASSMHSCVGSLEGARRRAFSGALHRVSIGVVLVELLPFGCLTHCVGCSSVSASSMHSCVGSSERARRHALSGASHRVSNGPVPVEVQLVQCLRHSVDCSSVTAAAIHSCVGLSERCCRCALSNILHRTSNGAVLTQLQLT